MLALCSALAACGGEGRCASPPCQVGPLQCDSDEDCFQSEYCNFSLDSCGAMVGDQGRCEPRPSACTDEVDLVCGCDGQFHSNTCVAASQGVDIDSAGSCAVPPNAFACGPRACDRDEQVCFDHTSDTEAHFFQCEPFPEACRSNRTCTCLRQFGCGDCTESNGTFTFTCFSGPFPEG